MGFGYEEAELLAQRELEIQHALAVHRASQVLNIPCLLGPVGGGKTSIAWSLALKWELTFCPINCGENSDATDVSGVPVPPLSEEATTQHMRWMLNKYAQMACKEPVFLFFDDLDKAPPPVQSALLAIFANRMFRDQALHPGTLVMCAGNRVGDDEYANAISESLRTRMTILEMEPDPTSFAKYGTRPSPFAHEVREDPSAQMVHPTILGYLQYKLEHLHMWREGVNRFPTPRGWWECSRHFYAYPDPQKNPFPGGRDDAWRAIVARKVGDHVANDFWAWFKIISKIDVATLLTTGTLMYSGDSSDHRMAQYAAIFAVAQQLAKKVDKKYVGLEKFLKDLAPEMRVAFVVQLPLRTRSAIATTFPSAASLMMSDIVRTADSKAVLRPQTGSQA